MLHEHASPIGRRSRKPKPSLGEMREDPGHHEDRKRLVRICNAVHPDSIIRTRYFWHFEGSAAFSEYPHEHKETNSMNIRAICCAHSGKEKQISSGHISQGRDSLPQL